MMENHKIIYDNLDMLFITLINANYVLYQMNKTDFLGGNFFGKQPTPPKK